MSASDPSRAQDDLDNLAVRLFAHDVQGPIESNYCFSNDIGVFRYDIKIDRSLIDQTNPYVPEFSKLGENEKFLINKIFFSVSPIVVIVGAVGSGKSTFIKLFLSKFTSLDKEALRGAGITRPPVSLHADMLRCSLASYTGNDETEIKKEFISFLSDMLVDGISRFYTIDEEVTRLWEQLTNLDNDIGPAARRLKNELRNNGLDRWQTMQGNSISYEDQVAKRRALFDKLKSQNSEWFLEYLAECLECIKKAHFNGHPWGVVLTLDNIDLLSPLVQRVIRRTTKPLLRRASVRAVVPMRESTFRIAVTEAYSAPLDVAPHCGPTPAEAIRYRLSKAPTIDLEKIGLSGNSEAIYGYILWLSRLFDDSQSLLSEFVLTSCGYSIRKSFVLAQHCISTEGLQAHKTDGALMERRLKEGMIKAGKPQYSWDPRSVIDNVFCVHEDGVKSRLVKLRILHIAFPSTSIRPVKLSSVVEVTTSFGYTESMVRHALNEMMADSKRLIWTDSLLCFETDEMMIKCSQSNIYLAKAGKGFHDKLCCDFDYVSSVVSDTNGVPEEDGNLLDRIERVIKFLRDLFISERKEVRVFATKETWKEYERFFGKSYLSTRIIDRVANSATRLLDAYASNRQDIEQRKRLLRERITAVKTLAMSTASLEWNQTKTDSET